MARQASGFLAHKLWVGTNSDLIGDLGIAALAHITVKITVRMSNLRQFIPKRLASPFLFSSPFTLGVYNYFTYLHKVAIAKRFTSNYIKRNVSALPSLSPMSSIPDQQAFFQQKKRHFGDISRHFGDFLASATKMSLQSLISATWCT